MTTTGELLKTLRAKKDLTQEEVADSLGMPLNTYVRYENGLRKPRLENATKIAAFYGITAEELSNGQLVEKTEQKAADEDEDIWAFRERVRRDPDYQLLFRAANKATPEHIRAATAVLKSLEPNDD